MGERELPAGWEWKRLGDCCQTIRGIAFPSNSKIDHFQEGFVACLRTANIQAEVEVDDLWFIPEQFVKNEQQIVKKFDILISSANSLNLVGKVALVKKLEYKTTLGAFISLLRSNSTIDPKYLYYYLSSNEFKRFIPFIASTTTNISNLSMTRLAAFRMVVPPLPVQHQIVAILEQAEAVKRQRQEADALTGALLQSVFFEMFGDPVTNEMGWEKKELKKFGEIKTGNTPPRINPSNYGDFIEWIKSDNIHSQSMNLERSQEFLSEEGLKIGRPAPKKSILITCIAGSLSCIGNAAIADRDVTFNQQINAILPKSDVNELFLYYAILMSQEYIQNHATKSMTKMINKGVLSELLFICPPLALQQQFARVVQDLERIRERQVASGRQIEGLCEGLMQRAFGGELVV